MGGQAPHFARDQFAVGPLSLHENIRRPVLDDPAALQHHHAVEIAQGCQTMGDRNHRAPAHQPGQGLADRLFGLAVERGGRLIQQQDRRVLQEGARNGDPLPLPAGDLDAAIADHGRHALPEDFR